MLRRFTPRHQLFSSIIVASSTTSTFTTATTTIRSFHASFRAPTDQSSSPQDRSKLDPAVTPKVYDVFAAEEEHQNRTNKTSSSSTSPSSPPPTSSTAKSFTTTSSSKHSRATTTNPADSIYTTTSATSTLSEDEIYERKLEERRRMMNLDSAYHPQQPTPLPGTAEYNDIDFGAVAADRLSSSSSLNKNHKPSDPLTRDPPQAPFPHPEELIAAVSEFVHQAKDLPPPEEHIPMIGKKEEAAIARMDAILFHEGYVPDTEKFRVVRSLVYFDSIRMNKQYLLPALHEILKLLVPDTIFQVLRDVDIDEGGHFQEIKTMQRIEEFFGTVIEGKATDEEFTNLFIQIQRNVKALAHLKSFGTFVHEFDKLIAQSQTAAAVTEACLEFDPHGYGRIKAYEMRLALLKAIPEENFSDENKHMKNIIIDEIMLEVAEQTEEDGYVAYQQLRKN